MSIGTGGAIRDELFVFGEKTRLILAVIRKPFAGLKSFALLGTFLGISGSIHRYEHSMDSSKTHDNGLYMLAAITDLKHLPCIRDKAISIRTDFTRDTTGTFQSAQLFTICQAQTILQQRHFIRKFVSTVLYRLGSNGNKSTFQVTGKRTLGCTFTI